MRALPGRSPARRRARRRILPLLAVALLALAGGAAVGARHGSGAQAVAARYAAAWERGDLAAMHALLTDRARRSTPQAAFRRAHRRAAATATLTGVRAGRVTGERVPMALSTRVFGTLRTRLDLPIVEDDGREAVAWAPHLALPGLRPGERLRRRTALPPRARLLSADGTVLAGGTPRTSPLGPAVAPFVGSVGEPPREQAAAAYAAGVPEDAPVGLDGLERWLEDDLRGRPGGELRAGTRVLARTAPRPAGDVRSSIDLDVQDAAVTALAGRLGGIVALRPGSGEILALAGLATSSPQPPGSTFKVVTLAGAVEAGVAEPGDRFPVQTEAMLEGVALENANDEACGGTLREAFAESCNSVFAPLGAKLGAGRLVAAAERFGFNGPPPLPGAERSTLPAAEDVGDDLAVGSTAIGQGRILATTLQMALVAATIANDGRRVAPVVRAGAQGETTRVVSARTAKVVRSGMRAVVREGTGELGRIEGVDVAGKTGTAELRTTQRDESQPPVDGAPVPPVDDVSDTDAWFVAFAPASDPRVAVAVLLVGQGAGGATAAPASTGVVQAGLD